MMVFFIKCFQFYNTFLFWLWVNLADAAPGAGIDAPGRSYTPVAYSIGTEPVINGLVKYAGGPLKLDAANPVVTLDYGANVAGFPFVEVSSVSASGAQIELKYSEPFGGLKEPWSNGPFLYVNGLMNSFRTETFNVSSTGPTTSFFIQGGQRWQTITLLSKESITINGVGFRANVDITPINELPGSFSTSNDVHDGVWGLGARSLDLACVEAKSQPSTWEVTKEGALVRGQYPAISLRAVGFKNYEMSFSTKIVTGGVGWRVAGGANGGYGPYFVLTTGGPKLLSTSPLQLRPNSLIAGYGFSIINQQLLPSAPAQNFDLPNAVADNEWYRITTAITSTGYNISINGTHAVFVPSEPFKPYINPGIGTSALTDGTFGFGPFLNQAAYYRDVEVIGQDGSVIYTNSLTGDDVYEEYGVAINPRAVCLDGSARDREIWIGDFVHTARMIAVSTGRYDYIESMIDFEFDWQFLDGPGAGLVPMQAPMGIGKQYRAALYPLQFGQTDYHFFFLVTIGDYYTLTNDLDLLSKHWNGTKFLVETLISRYLDTATNLFAASDAFWFTAQNTQHATAPTALFVIALKKLVDIAQALGDTETADFYTTLSQTISKAINDQLWSPALGAYRMSLDRLGDTALLATAFTIRAGIANTTQATTGIQKLSDLFYQIGYKDSTAIGNGPGTQLSPNVQGFLLESLFLAHIQLNVPASVVVPVIKNLLEVYWPHMINQNQYRTGSSWEYLFPDGSPGIGLFTSLNHPWGGAPTYIYTDFILGVRRERNASTGEAGWVFDPVWEVVEGLGLTWAKGKMPLPGGKGWIEASWSGEKESTEMKITAPEGVKVEVRQRGGAKRRELL
ncbi:hypothetical protein V496_08090 [Pseudogymnoascus sp. VKM F-4515 (FW-2607)]|nr:hypothetical protein V496_08090 [Pseudogymnoascus sp. VKM F-4515 (FW-2607)]